MGFQVLAQAATNVVQLIMVTLSQIFLSHIKHYKF